MVPKGGPTCFTKGGNRFFTVSLRGDTADMLDGLVAYYEEKNNFRVSRPNLLDMLIREHWQKLQEADKEAENAEQSQ